MNKRLTILLPFILVLNACTPESCYSCLATYSSGWVSNDSGMVHLHQVVCGDSEKALFYESYANQTPGYLVECE